MYIVMRKHLILAMIVVIGMVLVNLNGYFVSASETEIANTTIFIDARFKLWDETEKMIDSSFNITLFYYNVSSNNSAYYKIDIDNTITEGFLNNFTRVQFKINETLIHYLKIYINNYTIYETTNIIIANQVSKSLIDYANSQWTINLSPFEWQQKERNLFFAVFIGGVLASVFVYRLRFKYNKGHGYKTYE